MLTHFSITQQGQRHIKDNKPCQDYSASKRIHIDNLNQDIIIAAAADGVGSCEYSQLGSETAVSSFISCVEFNMTSRIHELSDKTALELLKYSFGYALKMVEEEADARQLPLIEFDSTLTGTIYDGRNLWFGHIGDDGAVVLYSDGEYEMITNRHKGEEAHSLFPLRVTNLWEFGKGKKDVASYVLMTDGVLDYCVDNEGMENRVYFPFLEPALTEAAESDEAAELHRLDWDEYLSGDGNYSKSFRSTVTDDISFVVAQNPELVKELPDISFDFDKWNADTMKRKKQLDDVLFAEYRAYKAGKSDASAEGKNESITAAQSGSAPSGKSTEKFFKADEPDNDDCSEMASAFKGVLEAVCTAGKLVRENLSAMQKKVSKLDMTTDSVSGAESEGGVVSKPDADACSTSAAKHVPDIKVKKDNPESDL